MADLPACARALRRGLAGAGEGRQVGLRLNRVVSTALTTLSDDERLFRDSVYEFADREIRPAVRRMDEEALIPRELIERLFQLGVMAIEIPEELGGAGATFFHAVLAVEAVSRVDPSVGVLVDVQNTLVVNALMRWGRDELKRTYLTRLGAGTVGAYALSEAGSGSDAFALTTRATETSGEFVLNGRKLWITNGNEADLFIVFATIDPNAGYRGITALVVERGFPGFTVGRKEDKLGIRASSTCELLFEECRVPKSNVLGETGKGYKVAIETLNEGRIGIGAQRSDWRKARSITRCATSGSGVSSESRSRTFRAYSSRSPARRRRSRRRGSWSTTPPGSAKRGTPS
jgi:alkylation response protein AidB-like acyl-CoA dehydrogenase